MIDFDTFRCEWITDRIRIITYSCLALRIIALFSSAELFWYFSKFGRGWKWPCGELRIRYELLRTLRMWYVSLRNARIVADGFYVSSAGSVSVCVTGALLDEVNGFRREHEWKPILWNMSFLEMAPSLYTDVQHERVYVKLLHYLVIWCIIVCLRILYSIYFHFLIIFPELPQKVTDRFLF